MINACRLKVVLFTFFLKFIVSYYSYNGRFNYQTVNRKPDAFKASRNCKRVLKPIRLMTFFDPNREERLLNITLSEKSKLELALQSEKLKEERALLNITLAGKSKLAHALLNITLAEKSKLAHALQSEKLKEENIRTFKILFAVIITIFVTYGISVKLLLNAGAFIKEAWKDYYKIKVTPVGFGMLPVYFNQIVEAFQNTENIAYWIINHLPFPRGKKSK